MWVFTAPLITCRSSFFTWLYLYSFVITSVSPCILLHSLPLFYLSLSLCYTVTEHYEGKTRKILHAIFFFLSERYEILLYYRSLPCISLPVFLLFYLSLSLFLSLSLTSLSSLILLFISSRYCLSLWPATRIFFFCLSQYYIQASELETIVSDKDFTRPSQ